VWANSRDARVKMTLNVIPKPPNQYADFVAHARTHTHVCMCITNVAAGRTTHWRAAGSTPMFENILIFRAAVTDRLKRITSKLFALCRKRNLKV
jgi:hypothetical protein